MINFFSTRLKVVKLYEEFLKENPTIKDCPLTVVSFLEGRGFLVDLNEIAKDIKI